MIIKKDGKFAKIYDDIISMDELKVFEEVYEYSKNDEKNTNGKEKFLHFYHYIKGLKPDTEGDLHLYYIEGYRNKSVNIDITLNQLTADIKMIQFYDKNYKDIRDYCILTIPEDIRLLLIGKEETEQLNDENSFELYDFKKILGNKEEEHKRQKKLEEEDDRLGKIQNSIEKRLKGRGEKYYGNFNIYYALNTSNKNFIKHNAIDNTCEIIESSNIDKYYKKEIYVAYINNIHVNNNYDSEHGYLDRQKNAGSLENAAIFTTIEELKTYLKKAKITKYSIASYNIKFNNIITLDDSVNNEGLNIANTERERKMLEESLNLNNKNNLMADRAKEQNITKKISKKIKI